MLIETSPFPIQGPLREMSLLIEAVLVFFFVEMALLFLMRIIKKESQESFNQELAYFTFSIGFALMEFLIIIADYMTENLREREMILNILIIWIIFIGIFMFYKFEKDEVFFKPHFFSILFISLSCITIPIFLLFDFPLKFQVITIPFFLILGLFFLIYIYKFSTNKLIKHSTSHHKLLIIIFMIGGTSVAVGFFLTTDFIRPGYTTDFRLLGAIFQFIGAFFIGVFFIKSPQLAEYGWNKKIQKVFIMSKGGICLYFKTFQEEQIDFNKQTLSGALKVVNIVISELTKKKGISIIEKDKEVFLIYPREHLTGVIVASAKLDSLKILIERFMKTIEKIYLDEIQNWEMNIELFKPIENIAREIFLF